MATKKIPMYYKAANGKFCGSAGLTEVPEDSDLKYIILSRETGEEIGGVGRDGSKRAARNKAPQVAQPEVVVHNPQPEAEASSSGDDVMTTRRLSMTDMLRVAEARPITDDEESYYNDSYLRRVAADMTKCYGAWSMKDKTCDGCALRHECRQNTLAAFVEFVKQQQRDAQAEAVVPDPQAVVPDPQPEAAVTQSKWTEDQLAKVPFSVICSGCGQVAVEGTVMVKNPIGMNTGMYHQGCC
jgi:hypothetical protein